MNKTFKVLALTGTALLLAPLFSKAMSENGVFANFGAENQNIVWQHYNEVKSTDSTIGYREYWTNCTDHKFVFEKPTSGTIQEGTASSGSILAYLSNNYADSRFVAKKGTVQIDTVNANNWSSSSKDSTIKLVTGTAANIANSGQYASFKNYTWKEWKESQVGLDATYTLPDLEQIRRVDTFNFTYYSYEPVCPIDVEICAVDLAGNCVTIFNETVTNCSSPITRSIKFSSINFYQLKVSTKAFVAGASGDSILSIKDVSLEYTALEKGDVNISTTDASLWSSTAVQPGNNFVVVGCGPWHGSTAGSGQYLELRTYQWSDWKSTDAGLTATFVNNTPKIINNLQFMYYVNSGSFSSSKLNMEISIVGLNSTKIIDTLVIDSSTARDTVINYNKSFAECEFYKLVIKTTTNEPKGFAGNSCVFLKEMAAKYN